MMDKNTKIGILGAGIEGIEAVRYFHEKGYTDICLFDEREKLEDSIPESISFFGGPDYLRKTQNCQIIFRSPGIQPRKIELPRRNGVRITSTTQYFMEHCPCPIIGVTGTKGKGTTSTLITLILKEAGYDVYLGGNIGQSPLSFLDKLTPSSYVVLEMSSFQLQDLMISPSTAVVLRVSSDHLDYHEDLEEYRFAKSSIVRYQKPDDLAVFNQDYDYFKYYSDLTKAKKLMVSTQNFVPAGAYVKGEQIVFQKDGDEEMIAQVDKVALIGKHHLENILPAVCIAHSLNIDISTIQKVLYSFAGLPHRLEFVREVKGVRYYNDSFSTTPETSVAATYAFEKPVILIAGGSDKGADYTEWATQLYQNQNLRMILLIGQMAERMEKALGKARENLITQKSILPSNLSVIRCQDLAEAVQKAFCSASFGSVVVMSPAAASFDQFKNYKERGERFRELVRAL